MKYRNKAGDVTVEAITFDELVQHGRDNGGNIVNGMPWSFDYNGWHVTHENDDLYLVCKGAETLRVDRDRMLVTQDDGDMATCPRDVFDNLYTQETQSEMTKRVLGSDDPIPVKNTHEAEAIYRARKDGDG